MARLIRTCVSALAVALFAPFACASTVSAPLAPSVRGIYFHPLKPELVYAATDQGLYESRDRGGSWKAVPGIEGWVHAVALDPRDPNKFYVSSGDSGRVHHELWKTSDGGKSFRRLSIGLKHPRDGFAVRPPTLVALDPNNPARLVGDTDRGLIIVSENGGESWRSVYSGERIWSLAFDASTPNIIYAGEGNRLIVSRDAGQTWTQHHAGLETPYGPSAFERLVVSGKRAYAVVAGELMHSDDSAKTFRRLNNCSRFAVAASNPDIIFAGCGAQDHFFGSTPLSKSSDGGKTWHDILPRSVGWTLAIDPNDANAVYVGLATGGLLRTRDGGKTWAWSDRGMPILPEGEKIRRELEPGLSIRAQ